MPWGVPKIGTIATVVSGNLTLTEPAGIAEGDLMIAEIAIRSTVGFTNAAWTLIESQLSGDIDATNGIASGQMWGCRRGPSAPTLVFSRTGGDVGHGRITAYSGAKGTTFADCVDTHSSRTAAATSATVDTAGITTSEDGELIKAMVACGDNLTTSAFDAVTDPATASGATDTTTAPTNGTWLERSDAGTNTGADTALASADAVRATAGATGTVSATVSVAARNVMIVCAFKAAAGATTPQAIAATAVGVATLAPLVIFTEALPAIAIGVAVLSRVATFSRTLAAVSIGVVTLVKGMFKTMAVTAVGVPGLIKGMFVSMPSTAVGVPTMDPALLSQVNMPAVATGVPTLVTALLFVQNLAAVAVGVATMVAQFIAAVVLSGAKLMSRVKHHRRRR